MSDPRSLRSPSLRAALYLSADGRCQRCGAALENDWHAHHPRDWTLTGRTNVHEMEALCPRCNLTLGASMSKHLRPHQRAIIDERSGILDQRELVAEVTPGGGKSKMVVAYADALRRLGIINRVCWVVPRVALQEQAADRAFGDVAFLRAIGAPLTADDRPALELNCPRGNKQTKPHAGTFGWATTYNTVERAPDLHAQAMIADGGRTLLVIDECHHVVEHTPRARAIQTLADNAERVLRMSGALIRNDTRERIAGMTYEPVADSTGALSSALFRPRVDIAYSREQAIRDGAVLPLDFIHYDAEVEYRRGTQDPRSLTSLRDATVAEEGAAIWSAIRTDFAQQMTADAVRSWRRYREQGDFDTRGEFYPANRFAKLLVVCANIEQAREALERLRVEHNLRDAQIATSDETEAGLEAIKSFGRDSGSSVLVTVAMAYEGMDVPDITHVLCLTHIRAYTWHNQMLSRATRVSPRVSRKYCVAFVMDDRSMCDVVDQYERDQGDHLNLIEVVDDEPPGGNGDGEPNQIVVPIDSDVSGVRGRFAPDGTVVHPRARLRECLLASVAGGFGLSNEQIEKMVDVAFGEDSREPGVSQPDVYVGPEGRKAKRRRELKHLYNRLIQSQDWRTDDGKYDWARPRGEMKARMRRRYGSDWQYENATEAQLDEMIEFVQTQLRSKSAE